MQKLKLSLNCSIIIRLFAESIRISYEHSYSHNKFSAFESNTESISTFLMMNVRVYVDFEL